VRALVTGGAGFLGTYLVRLLADSGAEVTATDLSGRPVAPADDGPAVRTRPLDVRDPAAVERLVEELRPEVVYHYAGLAYVIPSWTDPEGTFRTNLLGTLNLLEAVRKHAPRAKFAFAGSGTEYGDPESVPTPEDSPLKPTSPYASSKAAADLLCYQYFRSFDLPVFRYRIFGTTGPGKRGDSVNDFASQIAELERRGSSGKIRVGNLDKARDVTDVRDAVRAMAMVIERGEPGLAYNIGSGIPRSVRSTLGTLIGFARVPVEVEEDPARIRRVDEPIHLADVNRLKRLGWSPSIPFERTLRDTLDSWRGETRTAADGGGAPG
jgi:GDP-4-dehydro-6-deoxy-D-mannose reductase